MLKMRKMKASGIEWIGEIPEGWEIKYFVQLFSQVKNKNIGLCEKNLLSLSYGKIKQKSIETVGGLLPDNFEDYNIIDRNDIVLRLTDLQNDQHSLRVGLSHERGIITSAYCSIRVRGAESPNYLYYYLHTFDIAKGFYGMGSGVRQGLNWDGLKYIKILLPPQHEQDRISVFLNQKTLEIDSMLSKTISSIEEYKKLKQAVITQAVTKGVRGEREMKDSGVEWIGEIPAEWSICPLKRLAAIQTGSTPSKTSSESFYSSITGTPWIKPDNLGFSSSIETTAEFLTEEGCSVARTFPSNTVYVGCIGSRIGNCGYSLIPCACNQQINALIFNERMYWKYGWYLTIFQEEQYTLLANGNVIQIINSTTQGNISCIVPSISEQREITAYLDAKCAEIDGLIAKKEQLAKELESYKKSLIYEVVTGKREV